jgi:hypothetical protein
VSDGKLFLILNFCVVSDGKLFLILNFCVVSDGKLFLILKPTLNKQIKLYERNCVGLNFRGFRS